MSGLLCFAIQVLIFKTQSNHSPKDFSNVKTKTKNFEKCHLLAKKCPVSFPLN